MPFCLIKIRGCEKEISEAYFPNFRPYCPKSKSILEENIFYAEQ